MKATEIYEGLTAKLVEKLSQVDPADWRAPWHFDASQAQLFQPRNALTRKPYQGGNVIALWLAAEDNEYTSGWWATYKQWETLGAQVRKGEKATFGIKWSSVTDRKTKDLPPDQQRSRMIPLSFTVFNVEQVDGWTPPEPPPGPEAIEHADAFFECIGANVKVDGRAYYSPTGNYIGIPSLHTFKDAESYYAVLGHEHTHWTGHPSRLNREQTVDHGSEEYAFEELVAELGSAFLCAHLGISNEPRDDHAQYLKGWLGKLEDDPKYLWKAATQAQAAVNYLVDAAGENGSHVDAEELVSA